MPKFEVRWEEHRVIKCYAEVFAESKEAAIKKAQDYAVYSDEGEYLEENESHTFDILPGHAKEIKE